MFGTKSRTPADVRTRDLHLTGLERAKLERAQTPERTTIPTVVRPEAPEPVLPPQPPVQPTPIVAPVAVKAAAPAAPQVRPVVRPPVPQTANKAQLIVGEGVGLKGDIFNCDLLRVEGTIEGNVKARKLTISSAGTLVGTAQIAEAEIEGRFDGTLTASGLLAIRGTGLVTGKIGYEHIEIDRGGQIAGEILESKQALARHRTPENGGTGNGAGRPDSTKHNPPDAPRVDPAYGMTVVKH